LAYVPGNSDALSAPQNKKKKEVKIQISGNRNKKRKVRARGPEYS
jgi:hypothetical protein